MTGGTGLLGGLVARWLVERWGVGCVVLASRGGLGAVGAGELVAELEGLGARVEVVACDVGVRDEVVRLVEVASGLGPVTGVVHAAGVLGDVPVLGMGAGDVEGVFGAKVGGAWWLHEVTAGLDLSAFVVFSSVAGVLGNAGQGNYAAANVWLDALVARRRALGLAGVSLAWGFWGERSGLTGGLGEGDVARIGRSGLRAMDSGEALGLFDAALGLGRGVVVPAQLDRRALGGLARSGGLPAVLRQLVRVPARRIADAGAAGAGSGGLAERLAGLGEREQLEVLAELVAVQVATVLGFADAEMVDGQRAFKDLGFDSLTAVELRNRLSAAVGLRLPATLVFDHPTPQAITRYLHNELAPQQ
ncbi:type I polyketide synthase, partial [Streptomyces sp. NPDC050759]|uniref:type I polyketide synthase n=1 Tax=Streptomyces sp. NPDC050759 TaxID=3365635 RepID=UPI0037B983E2